MPANPQTENGFVMIALDLWGAIAAADLPGRDLVVLAEVLAQSYGPQKRRDVFLDPITLEHFTGVHRNNVRSAIRNLEAAGILARSANGSHRFLKDYESWSVRGIPLRDLRAGGVLRFALSVLGRFGRPLKRSVASKNVPIQADGADDDGRNRIRLRDICTTQSDSIVGTIEEARASEDLRLEIGEKPPLAPPRGGRSRGASGKGDRGRSPESRSERRAREIEDELRALGERWAREGTDGR